MERMTPPARHIGMVSGRQVRRGLVGAAGWCLLAAVLGVVLAGCGSAAAATGARAASTPAAGGPTAASAPASGPAAPRSGCAGVNRATMVTIIRVAHLVPIPHESFVVTDRSPALVRALFRDFCHAVAHLDAPSAVMACPVNFGTDYFGAFYDGSQVLAQYTYAAGGCPRVSITVGSRTQSTLVAGRAAAAAPHLGSDFAAALAAAAGKSATPSPPPQLNPGGTDQPA